MESVFEAAWRVSVLDMESTLRRSRREALPGNAVWTRRRARSGAKAVKTAAKAFLQAVDEAGHTETWKDAIAAQIAQQAGGAHVPPPARYVVVVVIGCRMYGAARGSYLSCRVMSCCG